MSASVQERRSVGYSGTPLVNKLGLKAGMAGIFLNPPEQLKDFISSVPCNLTRRLTKPLDFIHLFALREAGLVAGFAKARKHLKPTGSLWISWPKAGKLGTDLNENKVRRIGLEIGLVDVKVAAIDEVWSGLKFVVRLKDR